MRSSLCSGALSWWPAQDVAHFVEVLTKFDSPLVAEVETPFFLSHVRTENDAQVFFLLYTFLNVRLQV